ncbi:MULTISPECIES: tautomerase family protein [Paraburkholderia]|uniref:tautomerase family protein n=1 Tax=Paraburkholderia TaxID=1822464 RepID=UPI00224D46F2|nr:MULTISPECIES: tautomerase family protein [Paraburkholderia]MCX4138790.1 tautomerase family protein [Paraburkholderia aspalathi]MCX4159539.1 tautomerase family protein [Paraburkholderia aspalathi]MDN7168938.1 tautomerase family protein [Paraburkholderia sp. SECH2]MDN7171480.1 tautomerase family protein [Paraburkholderia sp. SEWSISQ10-3 4]MDQ6397425.1 tautomerase family protein [Paraburkholderia aspalathi]
MPTLEVYLPAGHAEARKAQLIAGLTQATVDAISAPAESVRVLLSELPPHDFGIGGSSAADRAGSRASLLVIVAILIAGRTPAQKTALIAMLSETSAAVLDSPLDATRVMIKDIPNTDFGIGGQTAKSLGR